VDAVPLDAEPNDDDDLLRLLCGDDD